MKLVVREKALEAAIYAAVAAALASLYYLTLQMPPPLLPGYPGDAFFPQLVIALTTLPVAFGLARALFRLSQQTSDQAKNMVTIDMSEYAIAIAAGLCFAILLPLLGFEITCTALLFGLLVPRMGWNGPSLVKSLGLAVVTMLLFYGGFVLLLGVDLPLEFLPRYLSF